MEKLGFLVFHNGLFEKLVDIIKENQKSLDSIESAVLSVMNYQNRLLKIPPDSENYVVNVIEYPVFEELYKSIYHEVSSENVPLYLVAGTINLKDPEVPGYVSFSLPKNFINDVNSIYNFGEFLANATHERFERYLHKETILAKIYENAREDYHEAYTLNKEKNIAAFILYTLNKMIKPLHETITYAITYLVEDYILENYPNLFNIPLPLIDREFIPKEIAATEKFKEVQLKCAYTDKVNSEVSFKRFTAGFDILQQITIAFPSLCNSFLTIYPSMKSKHQGKQYDFNRVITATIQQVLIEHGFSDIMSLFESNIEKL